MKYGYDVVNVSNEIITDRTGNNALLAKLIIPLRNLTQLYYTLKEYVTHFETIDQMLFESIPEKEVDTGKYNNIELRSMKPLLDFNSFADDVKHLASFISQYESIMKEKSDTRNARIYTQRIENGSLRIVWGSLTIELSTISDIVKAIAESIHMFRMTTKEKSAAEENVRKLQIENDEKELAIINSQIKNIAQYTGLSSENPSDRDRLFCLCLPLVRYIFNNPVGKIGNYTYDLNNDLRLLESFYTPQETTDIKQNEDCEE